MTGKKVSYSPIDNPYVNQNQSRLLIVIYLWLQQKQQHRLKLRSYVKFCPWCRHTNNVYR